MLLAFFTLLLVMLALWAGLQARSAAGAAWRSFEEERSATQLERERLEEERDRYRAAQASCVYSSPAKHRLNSNHLDEPSVTVFNASNLPAYDIVVDIEDQHTGNKHQLHTGSIMPGESASLTMIAAVLTQKWGWEEHADGYGNRYFTLPDGVQGPSLTVNLLFRDASNQAWKRDSSGALSRIG